MRSRSWRRRARWLALVVLALLVLAPLEARADGSDHPPDQGERLIVIGPQAVVIQNAQGQVRMYDDPSQQVTACKSSLACLGRALGIYGVAAFLVYDNFTVVGFENNRFTPPRLGSPSE
jgi:hypothetical protein